MLDSTAIRFRVGFMLVLITGLAVWGFTELNDSDPDIAESSVNATHTVFMPQTARKYKPPYGGPTFVETFDSSTSSVERWIDSDWHITLHKRNEARLFESIPFAVDHGANCEPPNATHTISKHDDHLYLCRNHLMTALYGEDNVIPGSGYGLIYFHPNVAVDLGDYWAVQFDVSTMRTTQREWIDVWITPWGDQMQNPLQEELPDLNGTPKNGLRFTFGQLDGVNTIIPEYYINGQLYSDSRSYITWEDYTDYLPPDRKRRDTFRIENRNGRIRISAYDAFPDRDLVLAYLDVPDVLASKGYSIIQFGHHSYVPNKDCEYMRLPYADRCGPNTYHWDNVIIENAVPFEMAQATAADPVISIVKNLSYVPAQNHAEVSVGSITLQQPAPANAGLRFAATGVNLKVRYDGGSWVNVGVRNGSLNNGANDGFADYWVAIPQGTSTIEFTGDPNWDFDVIVRDPVVVGYPNPSLNHPKITQGLPRPVDALTQFSVTDSALFCEVTEA